MTQREEKIGLTFSQILSLITVAGMVLAAWISLNVNLEKYKAETSVKIENLEKGRVENATKIKELGNENKADHQQIIIKLDALIYDLKFKK